MTAKKVTAKEKLTNVVSALYLEGMMSEESMKAWSRLIEDMNEDGLLPLFEGSEGMFLQLVCIGD